MQIIPLSEGSFTIDQSKKFIPFDSSDHQLKDRSRGSLLVEIQPFVVVTSKDILLLDVTPLTLGVETLGSVSTPLITRNTTVPTSKSQVFSTAADSQTQVEINVLQGERPMAADNKSLGRFILDGIPPAPRGMPQIEVTFDIDANGILNVAAKDKATGKSQSITIKGSTGLSQEEIDRMTKEAQAHEEEDKKKKEVVDARNQADALIFTAEKSLKDADDKVPTEVKKEIEDEIKKVKDLLKEEGLSKEKIEEATKDLSDKLQKIGEAVYKDQKTEDGGQKTDSGNQKSDKSDKPEKEAKGKAEEGEVVE